MSTFHRYARMMPYIVRQKRGLAIILTLTIVSAGTAALMPWPLKMLVDYALGEAETPAFIDLFFTRLSVHVTPMVLIFTAAIASFALFALSSAISAALTWTWSSAGQRMVYDLAGDLFGRLQRLSLVYHGRRAVGDSLSRLTDDTWCTYKLASELLVSPTEHCFTLLTVSVVAWTLEPRLTLLMVAMAPVLAVSTLYFGRQLKRRERFRREAQARLTSFVHQVLTAIPVVHAYATERRNLQQFSGLSEAIVARNQHQVLVKHGYSFANRFPTVIGTAIVLYVGGTQVLAGSLSLGSLLVFIAYLKTMQGAFSGLLRSYGNVKTIEANVDRVLEILDTEDAVKEMPGAKPLPHPTHGQGVNVCLEQVTFGYENDQPVLENISLDVGAGETVALVGATGAGKTTLVSLIPRFFDPWNGRVLVNGVPVRKVQLASLRSQIALVLQEPFLLPLSVAENIAYGRPEASRDEVVSAAVAANADEFIQRLPERYDTVIGERGATLSGGQRQRLAIARALLKNAPVLILDEPTSALDAETEVLLLEALERLMANRTTFIIAHRLSTIRHADRVAVIDKGKLVEAGSHDALLAARGYYYRYHTLQVSEPFKKGSVT